MALFIDDLPADYEQSRDRLGISRVIGLGKRLGGEPDRLLVLLDARGQARAAAITVSGLAGESSDMLFCGPRATATATIARATPATIKILRMSSAFHVRKTKKADVAEHPKVFHHVGLLANEPLGTAELLFI